MRCVRLVAHLASVLSSHRRAAVRTPSLDVSTQRSGENIDWKWIVRHCARKFGHIVVLSNIAEDKAWGVVIFERLKKPEIDRIRHLLKRMEPVREQEVSIHHDIRSSTISEPRLSTQA